MKLTKKIAKHAIVLGVGASIGLFASQAAFALDAPKNSANDHRVRYTEYDPSDVIQLDAVIGVATHIVLEKGENYVYHVFGDSEAYAFTHKDNHLFFKPTAEDANSNLIVVTDKRDYAFRISYSDDRSSRALYKLVLRYPESEAKAKAQAAKKQAIEDSLLAAGSPKNWKSYTRSGDVSIAPVHAWDDGRQTWLQFANEADIPTVYRVTPDGQEVITNYHMADSRTMVLHKTAKKWHLRLGNLVLAIHNEAYGLVEPPAHTGTVSTEVKRVVKGASEQTLPKPIAKPTNKPNTPSLPVVAEPSQNSTPNLTEASQVIVASPKPPIKASAVGDLSLQPIKVWEDGGKTFMQFSSNKLPEIYLVDTANNVIQKEPTIYMDNTVSVDGVSRLWQLERNGAILTLNKEQSK